jgi:hypothetical protein
VSDSVALGSVPSRAVGQIPYSPAAGRLLVSSDQPLAVPVGPGGQHQQPAGPQQRPAAGQDLREGVQQHRLAHPAEVAGIQGTYDPHRQIVVVEADLGRPIERVGGADTTTGLRILSESFALGHVMPLPRPLCGTRG